MVGKPNPEKPGQPKSAASSKAADAKSSGDSEATFSLSRHSPPEPSPAAAAAEAALNRAARTGHQKSSTARTRPTVVRLISLDAFRGFIMILLAAGGFGLLKFSQIDSTSPLWETYDFAFWERVGWHFSHPKWISAFDMWKVSFWDLIQPAFMFMVGVSMPFSDTRREKQGQSNLRRAIHAMGRSILLILLGVFLSSKTSESTNWVFPNVLCQIGFGYFFAWALMNFRWWLQVVSLGGILAGCWAVFYFNPPPADYDYNAVGASGEEIFDGSWSAWSKNANIAYRFDAWLLPQLRTPIDESQPVAAGIPQPTPDGQAAHGWILATMPQEALPDLPPQADENNKLPSAPQELIRTEPTDLSAADPAIVPDAAEPSKIPPASSDVVTDVTDSTSSESSEAEVAAASTGPGWIRRTFFSNPAPYRPNGGGYTTLNFVPSIGTTLLGILCGQLLMHSTLSRWAKLGSLILIGAVCLGLGILAGQTICPIVKRIWTPSWVLFSGGYVIGMLALFYLLFDIAPLKLLAFPLVVVGMNSILIYVVNETIGGSDGWVQSSFIPTHLSGLIESLFGPRALDPNWFAPITLFSTTFVLYWLMLLWLHRQKCFLKI